jgi:hypothetical protein
VEQSEVSRHAALVRARGTPLKPIGPPDQARSKKHFIND